MLGGFGVLAGDELGLLDDGVGGSLGLVGQVVVLAEDALDETAEVGADLLAGGQSIRDRIVWDVQDAHVA